jgi:hypothetical protein
MKKYLKNPATIIGLISLIIFSIIWYTDDYMVFKDRKCLVIDKLTTPGTYRYSGKFYLILKEERGIKFDLQVSPVTFSQSKIGETKYFNLRNMDIKQTQKENIIYFFGYVLFGTVGFVCLIAGLIFINIKWNE